MFSLKRAFSTFVNKNVAELLPSLEKVLPAGQVSVSMATRDHHSHDESWHKARLPDAVVTPQSVEEVSAVVKLCNEHRVPLIAFGTGTGFEGGVTAPFGGISLDLMEMKEIVEFNPEDFDVTVQSGVTRIELNTNLHDTGLWFTVGADASLCGMCATNAGGTNAVRYGTMRDVVQNLQVVLANGDVIHTRGEKRRSKKLSAGYNMTPLFVGSEGTLGVITAATLKLYPQPEKIASAVCHFPSIQETIDSVIQTFQCAIPMARLEFLDDTCMDATNKYSGLNYPVASTLFLEFHGTEAEVSAQAELVGELCHSNGGSDFQWSLLPEERKVLWKARHDVYYACMALRPNCKGFSTDVCVPVSKLAFVLEETKKDIAEAQLCGPIVGHVGDGNFHVFFVINPDDPEEVNKVQAVSDKIVRRALAQSGTCTGEHGVGIGKRHHLAREFGEETISLMKTIKGALDPNNIMNPGKVFYADSA